MKSRISYALAVGAVCAAPAYAALVNVDFNHNYSGPDTFVGAGALGSAGDLWNGFQVPSSGLTAGALFDSDGTPTSATITVGAWSGDTGDAPTAAATDAVDLMRDYLFIPQSGAYGPFTVSLDGLTANAAYTLALYGAGDNVGRGDEMIFDVVDANEGTQETLGASATPLTLGQHYVIFTGTTSGDGSVDLTFTGKSTDWSGFNGLQIDVVPEPSSIALFGLAGLGLLRRRRS